MRLLEIDSSTTLSHILGELKNTTEDGLEITTVPNEQTILDSDLNKAIIEKVAKEYKKEVVLPAVSIEAAPEVEGDELGFIEGEDILSKAPMEKVDELIKPAAATGESVKFTPGVGSKFKLPKNKWVLIGLAIIGIIIISLLSFLILPSAEIEIEPTSTSKDTQVTLSAGPNQKEVNLETKIIPLQTKESTKQGEDQLETTGKKTIGETAKGRVTITNEDITQKQFTKGTIITPVSNTALTFKLDEDVLLEAAPFGGEVTKGVAVTATKPGPEGNLGANTTFKVGSESSPLVSAKNEIAFSGGTTREARVASAQDREILKNKILEKLNKEIEDELEKKVQGDLVVDNSIETKIIKETYEPKAVDAEGDNLKANFQVQVKLIVLKETDLKKVLVDALSETEKNSKVDQENLEVSATLSEREAGGNVKLIGKANAKLFANLDERDIKRHVVGKTLGQTGNYLDSLENVSGYKVIIKPSFFKNFGFMPFFSNKVNINLKS